MMRPNDSDGGGPLQDEIAGMDVPAVAEQLGGVKDSSPSGMANFAGAFSTR